MYIVCLSSTVYIQMFAISFSYYAEHLTYSELYLLSLGLLNISSTYLNIKHLKFSGLLCVPHSLTLKKKSSFFQHGIFLRSLWLSERTAVVYLKRTRWLEIIVETDCVLFEVGTELLYII